MRRQCLLLLFLSLMEPSLLRAEDLFKPTGIYSEEAIEAKGKFFKEVEAAPSPPKSVPVQKIERKRENYLAYSAWYENGRHTSNAHLIRDHGVSPATLSGLSQAEKDGLHGKMHGERPRAVAVQRVQPVVQVSSGGCPGGVCPTAGRFRRRRR